MRFQISFMLPFRITTNGRVIGYFSADSEPGLPNAPDDLRLTDLKEA